MTVNCFVLQTAKAGLVPEVKVAYTATRKVQTTMANESSGGANLGFEATLWAASPSGCHPERVESRVRRDAVLRRSQSWSFTGTTWEEFLDAGGGVSDFRESRWKIVQGIKPGDYLLCCLTRVQRFAGVLEARVNSVCVH